MSLQESSGSYWGLTRQVGPWKTTTVDKARAKSQYGGKHSGHADFFMSMNPTPKPLKPNSKHFDYYEDSSVVLNLDYKPRSKTVGKSSMVKDPVGASRGGDKNIQITNNYYNNPSGPNDPSGPNNPVGNTNATYYTDMDVDSVYEDALDGIKQEDTTFVIPRVIHREEPKEEDTSVGEYYQNNYKPPQYPARREMSPATKGVKREGDEVLGAPHKYRKTPGESTTSSLGKHKGDSDAGGASKKSKLNPPPTNLGKRKASSGGVGGITKKSKLNPTQSYLGKRKAPNQAGGTSKKHKAKTNLTINTDVKKVKGPAAGKRGQGKSMDSHIPIPRKQRRQAVVDKNVKKHRQDSNIARAASWRQGMADTVAADSVRSRRADVNRAFNHMKPK